MCAAMEYNLIRLYELCEDKNKLLEQLQLWKLIPREGEYNCHQCGGLLKLSTDSSRTDGFRWRCYNKWRRSAKKKLERCRVVVEFRHRTLFSRSKFPIFKILGFINLWLDSVPLAIISKQLDINVTSCGGWAAFFRELILDVYIVNKVKLGGHGKVIEIYESKFDKGKVHRGISIEGQCVFGAYERGQGRIFMLCVDEQGPNTLLPVIEDWIHEGSTIVSDYWKANECYNSKDYQHLKDNHSLCYKDPEKASCVNYIKSSPSIVRSSTLRPNQQKIHVPSYLAFYLFQKRCYELKLDLMKEFFSLTTKLYDPKFPDDFDDYIDMSVSAHPDSE